tara:strand:- start:355 stop:912 length:558 start_codon:yes stop_codon:yes gene_type:complete
MENLLENLDLKPENIDRTHDFNFKQNNITDLFECQPKQLLEVKFDNSDIEEMYRDSLNYCTDSGWDLKFTEDAVIKKGETQMFDFGLSVAYYNEDGNPNGIWMLPRSSIVKTPLRMANSIGLIDSDYRGNLKAVVDNRGNEDYKILKGQRLFQLASPSLKPFKINIVNSLADTERGDNGFGSTGQ